MKNNNNCEVAINSQKLDELYKEWSGEHHTTNSNKQVHDSAECCDFAEYCLKYRMEERRAKSDTKSSVLHVFSVVARLFNKPCPHCNSRNRDIIGYVSDGSNKHQYTMRQCRDCGEIYR